MFKNKLIVFILVLLYCITHKANAQSGLCDACTPFYEADLSNDISEQLHRAETKAQD